MVNKVDGNSNNSDENVDYYGFVDDDGYVENGVDQSAQENKEKCHAQKELQRITIATLPTVRQ